MACTTDKFVINRQMLNEFIITIKQNDSTLPMTIEDTDTFELSLFKLDTEELVATVNQTDNVNTGVISFYDKPNGQIKITLYNTLVDSLVSERGDKVDNYYLVPTYRLSIECSTVNNGNFIASVDKVYIK